MNKPLKIAIFSNDLSNLPVVGKSKRAKRMEHELLNSCAHYL
jgi:hypothetical protein